MHAGLDLSRRKVDVGPVSVKGELGPRSATGWPGSELGLDGRAFAALVRSLTCARHAGVRCRRHSTSHAWPSLSAPRLGQG